MKHVVGSVVALLALFTLSSCIEKNYTLGNSLVPVNQEIDIKTASFDIPVDLRMSDSLQTSIASSVTVGAIRTHTFGLFRSEGALTITPGTDTVRWGNSPTVRHIYLALARDTTIYLDPSQASIPQGMHVYQLNRPLDSTFCLNNSITPADYDPTDLLAGNVPYMGEDVFYLDLKDAFAERFFNLSDASLDSAELMIKALHGLYITCDDPEETLEGGRLNVLDLSSSGLCLMFDYSDIDGSRKSSTAYFKLGEKQCVNICTSGSDRLVTDDPVETIYVEGLCGIKPHISATRLREAIDVWAKQNSIPLDRMIVVKAAFDFPFEYSGDRTQFDSWSDNLFPCQRVRNSNGLPSYNPLEEITDDNLENGELDRMNLTYKSNASAFLQALIRKNPADLTEEDDLWIMPTVGISDSSSGATYYYSDYFYYHQDILNGTGAERHPVLRLTYTILQ